MKDNYFFDNAATSFPKPESVYRFMDTFARESAVNPGRSGYALSIESEQMVQQTRRMFASFFNASADPSRVIFTQNITDSINLVLQSLLANGGHVIASDVEHNSVLRPIAHANRDGGAQVSYIHVDNDGYINLNSMAESFRSDTRVVIVNHGSNVTGAVQDLPAISALCKSHGVPLLLDTAQTAGVLPIDLQTTPVDMLAFTGHKGLFGPTGIGGLVLGANVELSPQRVGGTGVDSADPYQPESYPARLEAGTLAIHAISGLHAAQQWFASIGQEVETTDVTSEELIDPIDDNSTSSVSADHHRLCALAQSHIGKRELTHIDKLINALRDHPRIRLFGHTQSGLPRVATLSLIMTHLSSTEVGERLDADHHICVRTGLHCAPKIHQHLDTLGSDGAVRFSPGYFTTDDDVEHAISALLALANE